MKSILSYYRIERTFGGEAVLKHFHKQHARLIAPAKSIRLLSLSPEGFDFGRDSRGAAQLALAILLDFTGNRDVAISFFPAFKREHVAAWPEEERVAIKGTEIAAWLLRKMERSAIGGAA